jgi:acetate kinase
MTSPITEAPSAVLVINSGSSSLKFSLIDSESEAVMVDGMAEALGSDKACLRLNRSDGTKETVSIAGGGHSEAMAAVLERIDGRRVGAIGHRVVHGGEAFSGSVRIDEITLAAIRDCVPLAPLHNPANLVGIEAAQEKFPNLPHVAVFDTAFHQTMPPHAYLYALPYELYENHKVRRYGFHGTSHRYVSAETARILERDVSDMQIITAHLGNGCSACAVRNGSSLDTTMGFTPLEGLVMGTRSGDIDPNLHEFLTGALGKSLTEITAMLNRESGLLGLSGISNDMRSLAEAAAEGSTRAQVAIDVFCYRLAKSLLALSAGLDRLDALVFTGGIGENSSPVREKTLSFMKILKPSLDSSLNSGHGRTSQGRITTADSGLLVLVVPTNEERVIAREAARFLIYPNKEL